MERSKETGTVDDRQILITRLLNAPRERVFNAWIDPEHLIRWYAPDGCTIHYRSFEAKPGGEFHSCIHIPGGKECWCRGVFKELTFPEKLVFTLAIVNENNQLVEPSAIGMDPEWPAETEVTILLEDVGGKTQLTLQQAVLESLAKRTGAYPSWLQQLDNLEKLLTGQL